MIKKTPLDKGFEALESETTFQNISCLTILDRPINPKQLADRIEISKQFYPKLAYLISSPNEDWCYINSRKSDCISLYGSNSISSYAKAISNQFLLGTHPWQFSFSNEECSPAVLSFVLHHSLGDGVSGLDFFHSLSFKEHTKSLSKEKEETKINYLGALKHLYKELKRSKSDVGINGQNSTHRGLILINFPYSEIQTLKKKYSTTAYPILLALVATAVNHYAKIDSQGEFLSPLLPVSIRGKNKVKDLSNEIGGATISLPLGIKDIGELISLIQKELVNTLNANAYYAYYLWAWLLSKLPFTLRKYLTKKSAQKTSFICTNLVGPNKEFEIAGSTIKEQYVIPALMPGHGLGFGFIKSLGKMQIAIIYDPSIVTEADRLKESFISALKLYKITGYEFR